MCSTVRTGTTATSRTCTSACRSCGPGYRSISSRPRDGGDHAGTPNEMTPLKRLPVFVPPPAIAAAAVSCGTTTSLSQRWSDPAYVGQPGQKMMIIALAKSERNQFVWESAFSQALQKEKVTPLAGSKYLPSTNAADEATLKQAVKESGAN